MRALGLALLLVAGALGAAPAPLPSDSVLQAADAYTDQAGRTFHLADRRGHVQIASMFYTSCTMTCPLLVDTAKGIEHALAPDELRGLRILFVSFDPKRDTTPVLAALAGKRGLDPSRWTLARTDAQGVRRLAALLDIRYRLLASGDFSHTSALVLLDAQGRILARTEQLGTVPDEAFLAAVRKALGNGGPEDSRGHAGAGRSTSP